MFRKLYRFYVAVREIYCVYLHVCGSGGGLFPVGPSMHTVEQSAEVIEERTESKEPFRQCMQLRTSVSQDSESISPHPTLDCYTHKYCTKSNRGDA